MVNREITNQSPEKQLNKLRETARSGGASGGGPRGGPRPPMEAPITPFTEDPRVVDSISREGVTLELTPDANDKDMEELLGILQERGIHAVLKELDRINNPHLEDDFHRLLIQYNREGHPIKGLKKDEDLAKVLNFTLLEVIIPSIEGGKEGRTLKDIFSTMEQLYLGLIPFVPLPNPILIFKDSKQRKVVAREHFAMEIAVAQGREEAVFYIALPRNKRDTFEKLIFSIFPRSRVMEDKDDYNIFNQFGATVIAEGAYRRSFSYPLKTADDFSYDPLNITLAAFSKLAREGEGASIQVCVAPAGEYFSKKIRKSYDSIQKGKSPMETFHELRIREKDPLWRWLPPKLWKDFLHSLNPPEKKEGGDKSVDAIAASSIAKKLKTPVVSVNIRIVASARTKERAEAILSDLEGTFGQYEDAQGNRLKFSKPKGPKATRELLRAFIFRTFKRGMADHKKYPLSSGFYSSYLLPMNISELSALFHFSIAGSTASREVKMSHAKLAPAPPNLPEKGILLGRNRYSNVDTNVFFAPEDRMRHFYTIGQTGTGKTNFLKNMIIQDIENGDGVCFIDPHGVDVQEILSRIPKERYDDVIYFDPAFTDRPMGLNMLEYDPRFPEQKTFVVDEMFKIFQKLYGQVPEAFGPIFEQYFRNATLLVLEDPETGSTLMDIARVLSDEDFRALKLSRCRNSVVTHFWEDIAENVRGEGDIRNVVPYITSKFDIFIANEVMRPIVGQQRSAFNMKDIMDNKKILLVNLSKGRLGDINANLLGLVLVGKILMSALARDPAQNPPPFYLYIDEFQNVTTSSIATILSEARKYKLSLTVAHQFIAQLEPKIKEAVFGNVGSMAIFRVGPEDAKFLESQFDPVFSASDMLHIDNFNAYLKLLAEGKPVHPFSVEMFAFQSGDFVNIDAMKQMSYQRYGRAREAVEEEIRQKYENMH